MEKNNAEQNGLQEDAALQTSVNLPVPALVALDLIDESATNPRRIFRGMEELVASIRDHGIETPVKLRSKGERFELIGGARRCRGARLAGLTHVPAYIEDVDAHELLIRQLEDNKNREDPHPFEEAMGYRRALNDGWTVKDLSRRLGVPAPTIYASLKMTELIPAWQERFLRDEITAGHAVLLAKLPEARQVEALAEPGGIYERDWDSVDHGYRVMSVREVAAWICETAGEDLSDAPFALDDEGLVSAAGSCLACAKYSAEHQLCHDRQCFEAKVLVQVQRRTAEGAVAISDEYRAKEVPAGVLLREEVVEVVPDFEGFQEDEDEAEEIEQPEAEAAPPAAVITDCGYSVEAVIAHGSRTGSIMRICKDVDCPVHGAELKAKMERAGGSNASGERDIWAERAAQLPGKIKLASRRAQLAEVLQAHRKANRGYELPFEWLQVVAEAMVPTSVPVEFIEAFDFPWKHKLTGKNGSALADDLRKTIRAPKGSPASDWLPSIAVGLAMLKVVTIVRDTVPHP